MESGTKLAPAGMVWVCGACGRRAKSRYGFDAEGKSTAVGGGWDSSCMTWAVLTLAVVGEGAPRVAVQAAR